VYHLIQQTDPSQPTKLMILGTACSVATELMGEIAQRFLHISQVATILALAFPCKCDGVWMVCGWCVDGVWMVCHIFQLA